MLLLLVLRRVKLQKQYSCFCVAALTAVISAENALLSVSMLVLLLLHCCSPCCLCRVIAPTAVLVLNCWSVASTAVLLFLTF
jgi:hypothetical protein